MNIAERKPGEEIYKTRDKPRNRKNLKPEIGIVIEVNNKQREINFGDFYKKFSSFIRNSPCSCFEITIKSLRKGSKSASENRIHYIERNK